MVFKDKPIMVIGGTGFIGSTIVNKLIKQNYNVYVIDLNPEEFLWRLEDESKCSIFKIDLRDKFAVDDLINEIKPKIIFHLAAYVNPERDLKNIDKCYSINLGGVQNLLLALNNHKYDIFINTGSGDEYGNNEVPFKETYCERPISPYSASKIAATHFCEMMATMYNKPIITVRPFLPYGPKQISKSLISSLMYYGIEKKEFLLTPCKQTRDFIFVEDLADGYISLAKNYKKVKDLGIFNIGSGIETMLKEIIELIRKKVDKTNYIIGGKPYRVGENKHFYSSIEKIKQTIGWTPQVKIEDGLNLTIEWWKNNREIWIKYKHIWE